MMQKLGPDLPPDVRIVTGVGHYLGFVVMYLPLPRRAEQIITYHFGSIGQALSQAVGAEAVENHHRRRMLRDACTSFELVISALHSGLPHRIHRRQGDRSGSCVASA